MTQQVAKQQCTEEGASWIGSVAKWPCQNPKKPYSPTGKQETIESHAPNTHLQPEKFLLGLGAGAGGWGWGAGHQKFLLGLGAGGWGLGLGAGHQKFLWGLGAGGWGWVLWVGRA